MSRLSIAIEQIDATRRYTHLVLDHVPHEQWACMPAGGASHVAWQVGHITLVEAQHALGTVCGLKARELVPASYRELFGKGSTPSADASLYPPATEMLAVMRQVHERTLGELRTLAEAVMAEPASHATGLFHDKFGLLMWVARHEMLHIGQAGLIRRLLGMAPYR